jgi:tetratricopeptide (TPR) repeat protein
MPADAIASGIKSAYQKLGYTVAKKPEDQRKRVVLKGGLPGQYVSIYDSDNDRLDTGELKELAVVLSRRLGTVAIVTSVYDSDAYLFIMYFAGRQVDSNVAGDLWTQDGLRLLSGKKRALKWREIFSGRDPSGTTHLSLEDWQKRLDFAGKDDSVFAEIRLGKLCAAAGVDPSRASTVLEDFETPDGSEHTTFFLKPGARKLAKPQKQDGVQELAYVRSDDDAPELLYFPAAWPVPAGKDRAIDWNAVTAGPGFRGLRIKLHFEAATGVLLKKVEVAARPFFNGQLTSLAAVAHDQWPGLSEPVAGEKTVTYEAADFEAPRIDPETRKKFLITLRARFAVSQSREATVRPVLEAIDGAFTALRLPPIKLRAPELLWMPAVGPCTDDIVARLNQPSVASACAILPGTAETHRARAKALVDAWIASLTLPVEIIANVHTKKHMTESGSVSKSTWSVSAQALPADKRWPSLLGSERDYQYVTIELGLPDSPYPLAGAVLQCSLRDGQVAKPEQPVEALQASEALTCALWFINDPSVYERCGTSAQAQDRNFSSWVTEGDTLQAWQVDSTWFPKLGDYETSPSGFMTLYESAVRKISHPMYRDLGLSDLVKLPTWPTRRLRFVGRKLWLGASLTGQLDLSAVERICSLRSVGSLTEIVLNDGVAIGELEQALAPILPSPEDIIVALKEKLRSSRHGLEHVQLGVALMSLAEHESGTERLTEAVGVMREALTKITRQGYPLGWAAVQNPLGLALLRLGLRETGTEHLEAAVKAFEEAVLAHEEALKAFPHRSREELAAAKSQLGVALTKLGERETATASIDRAIVVFKDALSDIELAPNIEGRELSRAVVRARMGMALLDIADGKNDAAIAETALQEIEAGLEVMRSVKHLQGIATYDAQVLRARALLDRLKTR